MRSSTVFISYSHKDEEWKNRLVLHLKVLEKEGILDEWDDRRIGAGMDWCQEIQEAIDRASVAILMVSANFLTSDFILKEEVPRLLERRAKEGVRIFPIIVKPCAWKRVKWLARMQVRPTDGRPLSSGDENRIDKDLAAIAEEVAGVMDRAAPTAHGRHVMLRPEKISTAKLPSTSPDLFGREKELKMLDEAWEDENTCVVSLVAFGGVGKTALVNVWMNEMQKDKFRSAERVYGWSFYSKGAREGAQASADEFIDAALRWFGDPDPTAGSPWDKGERLTGLIKKQRTLLMLDGLEPLQYPPGEMAGRLKDPGLQCLLRELARQNSGLCIITTRLEVDDLSEYVGVSVKRIDLEHLSAEAGVQLLRNLGAEGTDAELKQAVYESDGHALARTLLGTYLRIVHKGDIRQRDKIPKLIRDEHPDRHTRHARRVMESYEKWFEGKPELNILRIMGLFDRPAEAGAIDAVRAEPAIEGLTSELRGLSHDDWQFALNNLRDARLLSPEDLNRPKSLDCHPLIREHFGEKLRERNPKAWIEAHSRLYEYYQSQAEEYPDTIEGMAPLYAAVAHGCWAYRYQEALDEIYRKRILRVSDFCSTKKLGAFSVDLAALSGFFDLPWQEPVRELTESDKGFVLHQAGFRLWALGRLEDGSKSIEAGLRLYTAVGEHRLAATAASNLRGIHVLLGDLLEAVHYARRGIELADQSYDAFERVDRRTTLSNVLHRMGAVQEAIDVFLQAEKIQEDSGVRLPCFWYCELPIDKGRYDEALRRAKKCLNDELRGPGKPDLLNIGVYRLVLGRVRLQDRTNNTDGVAKARDYLEKAIADLRELGRQEFIVLGLLARAELHRIVDDSGQAQRNLDEAMTIATRGGMRLYEADCHLEYARLYLAMRSKDSARGNLGIAKRMIDEMGYHRRDPEVLLATAHLHILEGRKDDARQTLAAAKTLIDEMGCHRWDMEVKILEERLKV